MKKLLFLLGLTAALSVTASANNADQGDPIKPKNDKITFSINTDFLSIFTLFCVKEEKSDSLKLDSIKAIPTQLERKEN